MEKPIKPNTPASSISLNFAYSSVAKIDVLDTHFVATLKNGKKLLIKNAALKSTMDPSFEVVFTDKKIKGQKIIQSADVLESNLSDVESWNDAKEYVPENTPVPAEKELVNKVDNKLELVEKPFIPSYVYGIVGAVGALIGIAGMTQKKSSSSSAPIDPPIVDPAKELAISKIAAYADNNANPAPTVQDYISAGIAGVSSANLSLINSAVDLLVGRDVDTTFEIQTVANKVLDELALTVLRQTALSKIAAYADDNTNPIPTLDDYSNAGIIGITASTLSLVNKMIDTKIGSQVDTTNEVQTIVNEVLSQADKTIAIAKIAAYADSNTNPAPTVADYEKAGISGVTSSNLAKVNIGIDSVTGTQADTQGEIQTIVTAAIGSLNDTTVPNDVNAVIEQAKTAAIAKIAAYADSNTNPAPTVADYEKAGISGVTSSNLSRVNIGIDAVNKTDADTQGEIQAITIAAINASSDSSAHDAAIAQAAKTAAIAKIAAYADSNTNPAPTVADYEKAGISGVTSSNLAKVNIGIDAVTGTQADTQGEIQTIVTAAIGSLNDTTVPNDVNAVIEQAKTAAIAKIAAYADSNTNPALSNEV